MEYRKIKMEKTEFGNKTDFIGPYNYIFFVVIKIDASEQQLLKWLNIHMKSSFPKRYKSILIGFMKITFFYLDPYILLIFNLSC